MSAAELGRAAGRSGDALRQVERGERRPSPGTLRAVVAALGGSSELLEELLALGRATTQLADERPERRNRWRSQILRDDATRTRAIARGDWATASAATDRTLANLGIDSAAETLDELTDPARQAAALAMLDELAGPAAQTAALAMLPPANPDAPPEEPAG